MKRNRPLWFARISDDGRDHNHDREGEGTTRDHKFPASESVHQLLLFTQIWVGKVRMETTYLYNRLPL